MIEFNNFILDDDDDDEDDDEDYGDDADEDDDHGDDNDDEDAHLEMFSRDPYGRFHQGRRMTLSNWSFFVLRQIFFSPSFYCGNCSKLFI